MKTSMERMKRNKKNGIKSYFVTHFIFFSSLLHFPFETYYYILNLNDIPRELITKPKRFKKSIHY